MKITEGTPASVVYVTDTRAAVVVHRTPKRVRVALVETGSYYHENPADVAAGDYPVTLADGILDRPIAGTERTYTLKIDSEGKVYGWSGTHGRLALGHSVTRTDHRV